MDKKEILAAYRKGFITMRECAQLLGVDSMQIMRIINEPQVIESFGSLAKQQPANR